MPEYVSRKLANERAEIVRRLKDGEPRGQISADMGVSLSHVYHVAGDHNLNYRQRITPALTLETIRRLQSSRDSFNQIAKDLLVSVTSVRNIAMQAKESGFDFWPRKSKRFPLDKEAD